MQCDEVYKKIRLRNLIIRVCLISFLVVMLSFYMSSNVLGKYFSSSTITSSADVAQFGDLTFYEYKSDGTTLVTGDTAFVENLSVKAGMDINKRISLAFSKSEVAVYLFLIVEGNDWKVAEGNSSIDNKISIQNNSGEDMVYWYLNNKWSLLKNESTNNQFVFWMLLDPNTTYNETIMDSILVNSISLDDVNLLRDSTYDLSFKVHAISALNLTEKEAWQHISGDN